MGNTASMIWYRCAETFESAEEVEELSSQACTTTSAVVHTNQPTTRAPAENQNSVISDRTSLVSEISSENLTEVELCVPIQEIISIINSEEIADRVPSVGRSIALTTIQEHQVQAKSKVTVVEPEICSVVSAVPKKDQTTVVCVESDSDFVEQDSDQDCEQEVFCYCEQEGISEQEVVQEVVSCEQEVAVEVVSDCGQEVVCCEQEAAQEVASCCEQEVVNYCEQDISVIMEAVEKAQTSLEDLQRETTPEEDILNNGTGLMHASLESEDLNDDLKVDSREDSPSIIEKQDTPEPEDVKPEQKPKERTKDEKKSKKKEDKTIDHILRALSSLQTTEEKLAALCKKYADLLEDHRVLQSTTKQNQRKLSVVTREKDQLQSEHTKAVMAKSKLESLCRELQKHNQVIRQESLQRAREEDEKRKEISSKFQTTITEIQQQMQDHHDRNLKLREENQELAGKLKKFIEQYEVREKQVEKVMQHREIEQKLADAKLQQASAILKEEQERNKKEKELLSLQVTEGTKKGALLEAQLSMYKERYEEFQSTINKSNEMFQKFKSEMDKMAKRIKKLEKDGAQWKNKWENANRALLEMAEEKALYDKEKPMLLGKIQKLESLCRAMQAERLGRKVLEASSLDPSKIEESVTTVQNSSEEKSKEAEESVSEPTEGGSEESPSAPSEGDTDTQACAADSTVEDPPTCDTEESESNNKTEVNSDSETNGKAAESNEKPESSSQEESCQPEEPTCET